MPSKPTTKIFDVIIIVGGQADLAVGYYLRRANLKQANLDIIILDNQPQSGGAWQHFWSSLRLFSPASVSSLPGRMITSAKDQDIPYLDDVLTYLDP